MFCPVGTRAPSLSHPSSPRISPRVDRHRPSALGAPPRWYVRRPGGAGGGIVVLGRVGTCLGSWVSSRDGTTEKHGLSCSPRTCMLCEIGGRGRKGGGGGQYQQQGGSRGAATYSAKMVAVMERAGGCVREQRVRLPPCPSPPSPCRCDDLGLCRRAQARTPSHLISSRPGQAGRRRRPLLPSG